MFYKLKIRDEVRVPPALFNLPLEEAILLQIRGKFSGMVTKEIGVVVSIVKLLEVGEGIVTPGDGAAYYSVTFEIVSFKPELQEVLLGRVKTIADYGAFLSIGPIEGMVHISQAMDDYVSFSKDKVLIGKQSKRSLKEGDICRARVIAVSYKDPANPKIGLTMRQPGLGKLEWLSEEKDKKKKGKA